MTNLRKTESVQHRVAVAWKIGLHAARANLLPGLMLQGVAVLFLAVYMCSSDFRRALEIVARLQDAHGFVFSFATRALFAGLVPFLFQALIPSLRPVSLFRTLSFSLVWWGFQGVVCYWFYAVQAWLYGIGDAVSVVAAKVLTDMFVFTPLWGCPSNAVSHLWLNNGFSWKKHARNWTKAGIRELFCRTCFPRGLFGFPALPSSIVFLLFFSPIWLR